MADEEAAEVAPKPQAMSLQRHWLNGQPLYTQMRPGVPGVGDYVRHRIGNTDVVLLITARVWNDPSGFIELECMRQLGELPSVTRTPHAFVSIPPLTLGDDSASPEVKPKQTPRDDRRLDHGKDRKPRKKGKGPGDIGRN
jgi:hypothetical protein